MGSGALSAPLGKVALLTLLTVLTRLGVAEAIVGGSHGLQEKGVPPLAHGLVEGPLTEVRAVVGGEALLPCDVTESGDSPILVLFYNGVTGRPVYSIDSRSGPLDSSVHWSGLGDRANFDLTSKIQSLVISPVEAQDEGDYRCRVDFRSSPTRNLKVKLEVIVPPRKVSIINSAGLEVSGVIGPYPVGGGLVLTCQVLGGRPPPRVTWWHDGLLLDDLSEKNSSEVIQNILTLPALTRQHLYQVITCQAANSNMSKPLYTSVTLDMSFPPLEVSIMGSSTPMSEGQSYTLVCEAGGSRPPATLSWWMDGTLMTTADDQVVKEGNISRTTLHLTPTRNNDGAIVSCRSENPELPGAAMEDIIKLTVHYSPKLHLRAGQNLVMTNIKEGDDVYFECVIQANPPVQTVQWFLQGEELQHNVSAGVILTNQSLVLQCVGRRSSGLYTCTATNPHGSATSQGIQLSVKFSPVCSEDQKWTYGTARGQQVDVSCRVDAHPEAHSFRWAFNTSTELVHIPKNRTHFHRNRSLMAYTPTTHHDFGTLLCWAVNEVGPQPQPCVYLVVPAAVPEPVHNCSVWHNASAAGEVVVSCEAGWSGGLTQTFTLEVRQMKWSGEAGVVVASLEQQQDSRPHFTVTGLAPGTEYQLSVGASNSQGAAPVTVLLHHTPIDVAEKRTSAAAAESFGVDLNLLTVAPIVAVVAGAVASLVLCSVVLALVIRSRLGRSQNYPRNLAYSQPGTVYDKAAPHAKSCDDGGFDRLQQGPDLILVKGGREEGAQRSVKSVTPAAGTMMLERQVECPEPLSQERAGLTTSGNIINLARGTTVNTAPGAIVNPNSGAVDTSGSGGFHHPSSGAVVSSSSFAMIDPKSGGVVMNPGSSTLINSSGREIMDPSGAMLEYSGVGGLSGFTAVSSSAIMHSGEPMEDQLSRPVSMASPVTMGRYQGRVGRSASCTGRGSPFISSNSSTIPRRSSTVDLHPEFFPVDLSTSRESCV